ncbi:MAG TPA: HsdR family type I site-specific deoxyribonuclease [Blastocatellia bacterium]|nr:HsdR family type I site-specific deoxyribonuclease [Blastocatellia bacterium]
MTQFASFLEDHISQIPALQLLQNLGYLYLRPQEVFLERKGKLSNVLLEGILEQQLRKLNRITFRGQLHEFSNANIQAAIQALKEVSLTDGLIHANEKVYDLLSLGKSLEQTIDGDTKSFTLNYIDWKSPENNLFHVVEEFEVERAGSHQACRPDIVLFVNGIPFVTIECRRPEAKRSIEEAIAQQLRHQSGAYIPRLFIYSQLLLAVNQVEAKYATTGTPPEFWSRWQEQWNATRDFQQEVGRPVNKPLSREQKEKLFADRFAYARPHFEELEIEQRPVTEQDRAIYSLCRPERLLELAHQFILFDAEKKKIARYQQYFAVKQTLAKTRRVGADGRRTGGVIWHTQGSGKSLTMVMLAKALALEPGLADPRIVLVTDRVELDNQIWGTFHSCGKEPVQAKTGKHLLELLSRDKEAVITTVIDKFETAVKTQSYQNSSHNIFVLVDESHRSQYGSANARMQKLLPHACYIGFTGTPLKKREKNTAAKFGGLIDAYPLDRAVSDGAVVPLLYEGRHILQRVEAAAIDDWFERMARPLTADQRADLKRRMSAPGSLNQADQKIYLTAWDLSRHFSQNIAPHFKAQLTVDSKATALKFKKYLDELGVVSSEVLISSPDLREGEDLPGRSGEDEVQTFWKQMMEKYGNEREYNRSLINAFKHGDRPELIIVVDKLLTGFDAPRNMALYLARNLKEHALLQAIARVNRLHEGKDFGYIIDYYGILGELNEALNVYSSLSEFDVEDLSGVLTDIGGEVAKLPGRHAELCSLFDQTREDRNEESAERLLADESIRENFYDRLSAFSRAMSVAFSSIEFLDRTPAAEIERYRQDLAHFQRLRLSVKRRYAEEIDLGEYETKLLKLMNHHVTSNQVLAITPPVNIFDRERFQAEVDLLPAVAAKADTIAYRTQKTMIAKMEEDPFFYRRYSKILEDVIQSWRDRRVSDAEYLNQTLEIMNVVINRTDDDLPPGLQHHDVAKAFYGVINEVFSRLNTASPIAKKIAAAAALEIDRIFKDNKVVDWTTNLDAQNEMKNQIDDYLYALRDDHQIRLSLDDMDFILDKSIEIAKTRYVK